VERAEERNFKWRKSVIWRHLGLWPPFRPLINGTQALEVEVDRYLLFFRNAPHHCNCGACGRHPHHHPVCDPIQVQEGARAAQREGELPAQRCLKLVPREQPPATECMLHCDQELLRQQNIYMETQRSIWSMETLGLKESSWADLLAQLAFWFPRQH